MDAAGRDVEAHAGVVHVVGILPRMDASGAEPHLPPLLVHPLDAADKDLYDLPPEEGKAIPTVASSLSMALEALAGPWEAGNTTLSRTYPPFALLLALVDAAVSAPAWPGRPLRRPRGRASTT